MVIDLAQQRQEAHALLDQLPEAQLKAVRTLLGVMVDEDEEISEEEIRAVKASEEYFRNGGQGIPFEQIVEELGFTMEQVRSGVLPEKS